MAKKASKKKSDATESQAATPKARKGKQSQADAPAEASATEQPKRKKGAGRKPRAKEEGKLSALDAAVKVLREAGKPLNCQEMIGQMASKGYWTSPGGKTPASTLYAAILRELKVKKDNSRFRKVAKGSFEHMGVA